ncbi:tRNA glutamyl-Q(34) synthetase GluQRS [Vibrio quintilis]|uniref:Glutamyl-Q tRNA(Asp) synthetase n=1 Tax=Vibrio quintilis TaxID=1117707 RepID=A0A1M7YS23_9VIBR|nr:tRNA glutamyl-Q(34) synthetase GluQRS [Vibrio quintilis]SHO55316.1 Glutamyl-Q tRNA(Asp) synthetase [Vibrio quintilis]
MKAYTGRFAPSPSGPLHFGSLIAALGSYFQAKAMQGEWLVRIEDLDPPREMPGATSLILKALESYGLHWDRDIYYQSQRHDIYQAQIDEWLSSGQAYYCQCTRKQVKASGGYYTGTCREKKLPPGQGHAVRLCMTRPVYSFHDEKHGLIDVPEPLAREDFIIQRRDGLFAYNLAVVIDDIEQNVTQVVRGADLIEPTGRQISLYQISGHTPVSYLHLPLAVDSPGHKLSKQNHAQAIDIQNPVPTLVRAMVFLGFQLPQGIEAANLAEIIDWGCRNWHIQQLPDKFEIIL